MPEDFVMQFKPRSQRQNLQIDTTEHAVIMTEGGINFKQKCRELLFTCSLWFTFSLTMFQGKHGWQIPRRIRRHRMTWA